MIIQNILNFLALQQPRYNQDLAIITIFASYAFKNLCLTIAQKFLNSAHTLFQIFLILLDAKLYKLYLLLKSLTNFMPQLLDLIDILFICGLLINFYVIF